MFTFTTGTVRYYWYYLLEGGMLIVPSAQIMSRTAVRLKSIKKISCVEVP